MYVISFPISEALKKEVVAVIEAVRGAERPHKMVKKLMEVISKLADVGSHYFFILPLERANVGFLKINAVKMGVATAKKAILSVATTILDSMNAAQLLAIVDFMEEVVVDANENRPIN